MGDQKITVKLVIDNKIIYVPYTSNQTTSEDACILVCKQLGIGNVARNIFALRDTKLQHLMAAELIDAKAGPYDFRIRFKIPNIMRLKKIDAKAYEYYFHQVRLDIIENKVLELPFETNRRQLLGLGVTDMYRVMLEKEIPHESILNDYKKYIPKEVLNRHSIFVKRPIKEALNKLSKQRHAGHDASYVIDAYLREFETMTSEYPLEEYKALIDQNGSIYNILLRVSPFHQTEPGIKYCTESNKDKWHQICTIDEVCFISIRDDSSIEISRRNGIPFYVKFNTIMKMRSFVSLVDGYYRLSVKWIFNICKDVVTPSLQRLYAMKCHGPVGGEFAYAKLEEKRSNRHGCFILRESEWKYNVCFVDVCIGENPKPNTFKLERLSNEEFWFNDDLTKYQNLSQLMSAYNDPKGVIYLGECLPPSENDESPLLLCKTTSFSEDLETETEENLSLSNPICINIRDLEVFSASKRESSTSITITYKGRWKHTKRKKTDIAVKVLKEEHKERYLKDFLDLAGQWAFLQYNVIVKLYGVTLRKQLSSMVMEYVSLGPLDQYLRDNKSNIQSVDLMEATSNLASALWYLSENGIVHGNIRCKKVLVACHDENHFNVKLSDPGIHSAYSPNEVHWIPVEFYKNLHLDFARRSDIADVWAFGTTVYEMYLLGEPISQGEPTEIVKQFYISGNRLPMMKRCPLEVYKILLECWDPDPARRKQPQAIMRDFNQMLYQVYNSRKRHAYAEIKSPSSDTRSLGSSLSFATETTSIAGTEEDGLDGHSISNWSLDSENNPLLLPSGLYDRDDDTLSTYSFHASSLMQSNNASMDGLLSYHPLDDDRVVLVQTKIGQGCYGEVFKGTLEYYKDEKAPKRFVAVKKLKSQIGNERQAADFEREISIMKRLKHKNIVEILGVLSTEGTLMVMEYVPHGSLDSYLKIYKDTMTDKQLLRFASDIAEGMDYLGKMSIVHRDLAARNILVVDENHVKISDFGLAQVLNSENYYITMNPRDLPIRWYALESLTHGKFSTRSDVWSYGVTLSEMYLRGEDPRLPIEAKTDTSEILQLIDAYESGIRLARPILCPQLVYVEVIYPCWNQDPHKRPTFQALCNKISELMPQY